MGSRYRRGNGGWSEGGRGEERVRGCKGGCGNGGKGCSGPK